tara:strand:+ start:298 stop:780 length:483 start_codon:yes stop_codon:yes gene_type:complete
MTQNTFKIGNLELYCPDIHGIETNNTSIYNKHLILETFDTEEFYKNINNISHDINIRNELYTNQQFTKHPIITNYSNIIKNPKHLEIKIIQPVNVYFDKGEEDYYSTGIDKTIWIKIIQRRWKTYFKNKRENMMKINNLQHRELHDKFPTTCYVPFKLGL